MEGYSSNIFDILVLLIIDYIAYRYVVRGLYYQYRYTQRLIRSGIHVKGHVTGYQNKEDLDQHPQYASIVDFVDDDGNARQIVSDIYKYKKPDLQSVVDVYYDRENPAMVIIDSGSILLFRIFLLVFFIGILISVNVGMLYQILS